MKLIEHQRKFASDDHLLKGYILGMGYFLRQGEGYRPKILAKIYAEQGIGIENSLHEDRCAEDLIIDDPDGNYITDSAKLKIFGDYWKKLDPLNRWGGDFEIPDGNHFSRSIDGKRA